MKLPPYQDLSKEQEGVNNVPLAGSYLVTGPPGTGKTVIALYRSQMVERRGRKANLIMFNGLLKRYTEAALADLNVGAEANTGLSWFYGTFWENFRVYVPNVSDYHPDWDFIMETLSAKGKAARVTSDLIIDEGQDLPPGFYRAARVMAENITVFADENQTISPVDYSTFEQIRHALGPDHKVLRLRRNYRNTLQIAQVADFYFTDARTGTAEPPAKVGPKPQIRRTESLDEAIDLIRTYEANNDRQEIGVFVTDHGALRAVKNALQGTTKNEIHAYFGNKASGDMSMGEPGVRIMCSESAKGLEFDAVFIPEVHGFATYLTDKKALKRRFYVMTSRAREALFMFWSGSSEPAILKGLPDAIVDRRKGSK
jgi:DNA helicase IV